MLSKKYVIGDIHGCAKTLSGLLFDVCSIQPEDTLIFLGDLIDTGPDSKAVLDIILSLENKDIQIVRGNHEQMLLNSLNNSNIMQNWYRNGGKSTLDSFNVFHPGFIEDKYLDIIFNTKFYVETDEYVITHAGLNFASDDPLNDKDKMLTHRSTFCEKEKIGGRKLIVGHTPNPLEIVKSSLHTDLIKLDAGCVYYKKVQGLGFLAALELNSFELFYIQNCDYD